MGESGETKSGKPSQSSEEKAVLYLDSEEGRAREAVGTGQMSPKELVRKATAEGRLTDAQSRVLMDLCSRMSLLGFEARRSSSVLISKIAKEEDPVRRKEIAFELYEYLMNDALAKNMMQSFSTAFNLR